ncbi:MAG: Do family serine endopeptidase [Reyranellaceae bacterium]
MLRLIRSFPLVLVLALAAPLAAPAVAQNLAQNRTPVLEAQPAPSLAPLVKTVTPAVVNISVVSTMRVEENPLYRDPFFRRFFNVPDQPQAQQRQAAGSGVIVDAGRGYVMTNNHVVARADKIAVTLKDGRTLNAKLIGTDPGTDIAVLQIPAENLTALPLGDSGQLEVGDYVVAIGNPFGLGQTVTSGIVSALGRSGLRIEGYEDFIQTDASINPGNSGGALVDLRGRLVGINTAIIAPSGGNVGIGFAVPINMARAVFDQLVEYGKVQRGRVGVQVQDVTPEIAAAIGMKQPTGALIARVEPNSPAAKAGLKQGDVVLEVNGTTVRNSSDLRNRIGLVRIGEKVDVTYRRNEDERSTSMRVADMPLPQREQPQRQGLQQR